MIKNLDYKEIDLVDGAGEKSNTTTVNVEIPLTAAVEAAAGFVLGLLEAWSDDK